MITYLNKLVGARYKDSTEQSESNNFLLIKIMQDFKNTKVEEIHLAFELAVKGKLNLEVYRILDYKAFCDVMLAYEEYKKENIGQLVQMQMLSPKRPEKTYTENDTKNGIVEFLKESWELTTKGKINELTGVILYDYLKQFGLINFSREEKFNILHEAKEYTIKTLEEKKQESNFYEMRDITRILKNLADTDDEVIINCKRFGLKRQINYWIKSGVSIESVIKTIWESNL